MCESSRPHWDDTSTGVGPRKTKEEKSQTTYGMLVPGAAPGRVFTENNRPDPAHETRAFPVEFHTSDPAQVLPPHSGETKVIVSHFTAADREKMRREGWYPSSEVAQKETVRGYLRALERHVALVESELGALKETLRMFRERAS